MLFAHNGTVDVTTLLSLIAQIDPFYLEKNPPDYTPQYLDSNLWAILIIEILDTYPDLSIEECIRMAVIKLDSALVLSKAELNFAMSTGNTLWALNFTKPESKAITVYYYPDSMTSPFWIAASQPIDANIQNWVEIPNHTLACLKPNEPVRLIPIFQKSDIIKTKENKIFYQHPNPFNRLVAISYYISENKPVIFNIYDESGRFVKRLIQESSIPGAYTIHWDGSDEHGIYLPSGSYFCHIKNTEEEKVLKLILSR